MAYRTATRLAIRSASAVLAPTEATRRDIERFYGVTLPHEAVVLSGVGVQFFAVRARAGRRPRPSRLLSLPGRYILHVGARRPHKNQEEAVSLLDQGQPITLPVPPPAPSHRNPSLAR